MCAPSAKFATTLLPAAVIDFMVPAINCLAVLVALIVSMVISVFYPRAVFGRAWMNLVGQPGDAVQAGSPLVYPVVIVASFLTAWVLAGTTYLTRSTRAASWSPRW